MKNDTISRQAAIEALCDNCNNVQALCPHYPCKQYTAIDALPSAEPKKGKWIDYPKVGVKNKILCHCSECGMQVFFEIDNDINPYITKKENYRFCPNCGAMMEE